VLKHGGIPTIAKQNQRIAVFLPGIMGSTLEQGGVRLWSKSAWDIYETLVDNPGRLMYHGAPARATDILSDIQMAKIFKRHLYTETLEYLKSHPDFSKANNTLLFAYDWRQAINETIVELKQRLISEYGLAYDARGKAIRDVDKSFVLIGHSLGGLILLLSAFRRLIHPRNIESLILVGAPLTGSPRSFRSLFDRAGIPLLEDLIEFWWGKNAELALRSLRTVLQSCPSVFELMPPVQEQFVWNDNRKYAGHPFHDKILDTKMTKSASRTHQEINAALKDSVITRNKLYLIYGLGWSTDEFYFVQRQSNPLLPYHLIPPYLKETREGDGTVTCYSATRRGALRSINKAIPVALVKHSQMCNSRRIVDILKTIVR